VLKWPLALACVVIVPVLPDALLHSALAGVHWAECEWLGAGAGLYLIGWLLLFRHPISGSYFSTFEHELTHAIFAWATLHRVTGLRVTWRDGGACRYVGSGGGNWLISLGPYWFPTLAMAPLALLPWVDQGHTPWLHGLIGFITLYQLTSTWRETHYEQPDLRETGLLFAAIFLPVANIITYAMIALVSLRGWPSGWALITDITQRTVDLVAQVMRLAS
jgi:hypothetical protein